MLAKKFATNFTNFHELVFDLIVNKKFVLIREIRGEKKIIRGEKNYNLLPKNNFNSLEIASKKEFKLLFLAVNKYTNSSGT